MQTKNDHEAREKVWDLIKDIRVAQLVTHGTDRHLHARPMSVAKREGNTLWFYTRIDSGKTDEIIENPQVLLSYSEPKDQNYVAISGQAHIVKERAKIKELWSEYARTWFPKGPDDPAIALIRVDAEAAEYWDAPSAMLVYAYGYAKARLTGEIPKNIADMGHVDIKYTG